MNKNTNIDKNTKNNNRCSFINCNKKITIYDTPCKCNLLFCKKHKFFKDHNCTFDYVNNQKIKLLKLNPKIINKSLEVI